jgi:hypothetical protein
MITRTIDGQAVIMDPLEGKLLTLNEVGTFIWEMADGNFTQEDMLTSLCREFEVSREAASSDLDEFTATLREKSLLLLEE